MMMTAKIHPRHIAEAKHWAAANKSDPFAFDTAMSHMMNGVASYRQAGNTDYKIGAGVEAFYSAKPVVETRKTHDGEDYPVVIYQSLVRP